MNNDALITVLLKRMWILEKMVADICVLATATYGEMTEKSVSGYIADQPDHSFEKLTEKGSPFNPQCQNCGEDYNVTHEGSIYEFYHCEECEAWMFANPL